MLVAALGRISTLLFYLNLVLHIGRRDPDLPAAARDVHAIGEVVGAHQQRAARVAGISVELRGLEKIPPGALLVASKHQSFWETFTLLTLFDDPAYVLKRELMWIPVFGWFAGNPTRCRSIARREAARLPA